jgi:hypothetical protein
MLWWLETGSLAVFAIFLALAAVFALAWAIQRLMSRLGLDRFTWSWRIWLWPFLILELLVDAILAFAERFNDFGDRVQAWFGWLLQWRLIRFAAVFAAWALYKPWLVTIWPPALAPGPYGVYLTPVLFVVVYWPAAAALDRCTQRISPRTREIAFKLVILTLGIYLAGSEIPRIAQPNLANIPLFIREAHLDKEWLLAVMFASSMLVGFILAILLVAPLWIFWRRTPAPLGPKYGDAQFANPTALKSQGVVDER